MSNIWHYGLMAERWAEFHGETPELAFIQATIERFGRAALYVACAPRRYPLPLCRMGFDVDGAEQSTLQVNMYLKNEGR